MSASHFTSLSPHLCNGPARSTTSAHRRKSETALWTLSCQRLSWVAERCRYYGLCWMVKAATGGTRTAARTVQGLCSTSKLPSSSLTPRSSQSHMKVWPTSGNPGMCTTTTRTSASMERDISVRSSKPRSCLGPSLYYFDF